MMSFICVFFGLLLLIIICLSPDLNSKTKNGLVHFWFAFQFEFMFLTIVITIFWFVTGKEYLFDYGNMWEIIERGTLDSLSSVVGVIGVGSLLLGWAYSERDRITLGKTQIDIIHYRYGVGYGLSIVIHFVATAFCMVLLECEAKEAALWAFVTIIVGCIPQVTICLSIVFNRRNREHSALTLWKQEASIDAKDNSSSICKFFYKLSLLPSKTKKHFLKLFIREKNNNDLKAESIDTAVAMANHLGDFYTCHNIQYQYVIAEIIASWLNKINESDATDLSKIKMCIHKLSFVFRELFERVSDKDLPLWEESILKKVCEELSDKPVNYNILAAAYLHFLYCKSNEEISFRINRMMYYSENQTESYDLFCKLVKSFYYGLQWYQFLDCGANLPSAILVENAPKGSMGDVFEQMILAIYQKNEPEITELAKIAWSQV